MKTIEFTTDSYNHRRFYKPWIATVTYDDQAKPVYKWGNWIGKQGEQGLLVIAVKPGDIVAKGQKDTRGNCSTYEMYIVDDNCELKSCTRVEAYKHSLTIK